MSSNNGNVLERINLLDIEPADYNPRKMNNEEYSKLSRSINDYGLVDPIIINLKNNKIVGGHQRYNVLLNEYTSNHKNKELFLLRLGDIGWAFTSNDLKIPTEEHEKALNIALNQSNLMGEWDDEKLSFVLQELSDVNFDLDMTGFEDYELDLYLDDNMENFTFNDNMETVYDKDDNDLPSDYMDITGDTGDRTYVVSVGFDNQTLANKYLDYLGYDRQMNKSTVQLMFKDLDFDLDQALLEKYGEEYFTQEKIKE